MRGLLTWALIVIVILVILLATFGRFWVSAVEASTSMLASVQAAHIAGIINTMQTAPEKAERVYVLPSAECEIKITPTTVYISLPKGQRYSANLIISDIAIDEKIIECSEDEERAIRFEKKNGRIEITQLPVVEDD